MIYALQGRGLQVFRGFFPIFESYESPSQNHRILRWPSNGFSNTENQIDSIFYRSQEPLAKPNQDNEFLPLGRRSKHSTIIQQFEPQLFIRRPLIQQNLLKGQIAPAVVIGRKCAERMQRFSDHYPPGQQTLAPSSQMMQRERLQ